MIKNQIFFGEEIPFQNHWKNITIEQINEVIPEKFLGKESFINFYTCYNGGDFTEYARFYPNELYELPESHQGLEMDVLGFFPISLPNEEGPSSYSVSVLTMEKTKTYGLTIQNQRDLFYKKSTHEFKEFFSTHIPFANDCADSTYLIDIKSGEIKYLDFDDYFENPKASFVVASSFEDFCKRIKKYNIG